MPDQLLRETTETTRAHGREFVPAAGYVLTIAVQGDSRDPIGKDRLASASRNLLRSWGVAVVAVQQIAVEALPPLAPGRLRGDEAFGPPPEQRSHQERMGDAQRGESGLTATQESRMAAAVAKAKQKEAARQAKAQAPQGSKGSGLATRS